MAAGVTDWLWDVHDLRSTVGVIRAEGGKSSVIVASLNEHDYAFLGQPFPLIQLHGRCTRNEATAVGQNRTGNFSWARLAGVQTLRFRQSSLGGQVFDCGIRLYARPTELVWQSNALPFWRRLWRTPAEISCGRSGVRNTSIDSEPVFYFALEQAAFSFTWSAKSARPCSGSKDSVIRFVARAYFQCLKGTMPQISANLALARKAFREHGGMLRTANALRLGIHPRSLYALRDSGEVIPVGRGLYRLANAPALTNPDWIKVGLRIPRAVICLISALAHYELTTQVPHYVDIALQSHAQVPKVDGVPVRVFWFPPRAFEAGVETVTVDRVPIKIYSPEKTIADCFKYRNKVGLDVAIEALRTYRERVRKFPVNKLMEYARICRVERVMRPDIKVSQELLRHASSRVTLDTYTQAVTLHKRKAQSDVIRLLHASGAAAS